MHAAQGATADTTHAVLADTATRNLAYVALTRGRASNHAYLYQRTVGEGDHQHRDLSDGIHLAHRGTPPTHAGRTLRHIIGNDTPPAQTAHHTAAQTPAHELPERVAALVAGHQRAVTTRLATHRRSQRRQQDRALERALGLDRSQTRSQERDQGYDLSL